MEDYFKEGVTADLPARATPLTDEAQWREVLAKIVRKLDHDGDLEQWVAESPLVEVTLL